MVPTPSAEGWDRLTDAWLERCDGLARGDHYREGVPIRDLFETDLDHMLPLPPSMFDACDWRGVMDWQRCVGQVLRGRVPVR